MAFHLSPAVTVYVPASLIAIALFMGVREWRLFRKPVRQEFDPFPYTRGQLARRFGGLGVLIALAVTLASLGKWPPQSTQTAGSYFTALSAELGLLVTVLLLDLWALGRTRPRSRVPRDRA